jgi:CRP-like cAMP-binding protein
MKGREHFDEAHVRAGEMIAREGTLCHQLVVLVSGELLVTRQGLDVVLRPGDSYGWKAMDERGVNDATVVARTDATVLVMGHAQFRAAAALSQEKRPAACTAAGPWKVFRQESLMRFARGPF